MKYLKFICFLWLLYLSSGCGSAEAVKRYNYPITKDNLEKAVMTVINTNPHIVKDTTPAKVKVRRNPGDPNDTSTAMINLSDFHSPDSANVAAYNRGILKIKIKVGEIENDYIFRYLGDEQYWKSSSSSAIFIQKATDKNGNTIAQGENKNGEFDSKMAKDFTSLFEEEVVNKIDKELGMTHSVD